MTTADRNRQRHGAKSRSLRTLLTWMIWLCVGPLVLLAAYLSLSAVLDRQAERDLEAAKLSQSIASMIDEHLHARISALHILAESPLIDTASRWNDLYREAQGFHQGFGSHVIFADLQMHMPFNTRVPFGSTLPPLPRPRGHAAVQTVLATGKPAVGDSFMGPIAKEPLVAIAVPVVRRGTIAFLMLTIFETRQFQERLDQVSLPAGWALTLLDGKGEVLARRAPPGLNSATDVDTSGRFVTQSTRSPWSVVLEIPRSTYRKPLIEVAVSLAIAILGVTFLSLLGGTWMARRLAQAVTSLTDASPSAAPGQTIAEIEEVRTMLDRAAAAREASEKELRESEARYRSLFEAANVGKSITLPSGTINVNRTFCQMLGYSPDELHNKTWQELTPPEEVGPISRRLAPLLSGHQDTIRFEKRYIHKNGSYVLADVSVAMQRDTHGKPLYFITTIVDISERKKAEEKITEQLSELQRWHDVMLDREDRVIDLKKEVNELLSRAGQPTEVSECNGAERPMNIRRPCRIVRYTVIISLFAAIVFFLSAEGAPGRQNGTTETEDSRTILQSLTEEERAWLEDHRIIRVVQDPDWPPIEFADERGKPSGMAEDYLRLIEQRLGITFQRIPKLNWQEAYVRLKRWDIDMTTSVTETPERSHFWAFTKPYMKIPIVIVTNSTVAYVAGMEELAGKKVAVVEGYAVCDWVPRDYPSIELIRVKTAQEGLETVRRGEVFAFMENMLVVGHYLAKLNIATLKIAGNTPYVNAQSMAVRRDWATLAGILDKVLGSISETERNDIYRRWVPVRYEHSFDRTLLWQALAIFAVILLVSAAWIWKLTREIAGRKKAEGDSRRSEEHFRQLFKVAPMPLGLINAHGAVVEVNDQWEHAFGYTREDVPTIDEWWLLAYPDADYRHQAAGTWENAVQRARENNAAIGPHDYRVTCRDGTVRTIEITGTFLGDNILAAFLDVTDRKDAETEQRRLLDRVERAARAVLSALEDQKLTQEALRTSIATLEAALNSMSDAVFISDREGTFIHFNHAFAVFHKFRNKEECTRALKEYPALFDMYVPEGRCEPLEQWPVLRALGGETVTNAEYSLCRKDTGEVWVGSYNFSPIRNADGVIVGSVVVCRDITERKKAEKNLNDSQAEIRRLNAELEQRVIERTAQLEAANRELEAFSYSVSHDLKAPLRAVDGYIRMLYEDYGSLLNDEGRRICTVISDNASFMGQLIQGLLVLSRLGRTEMQRVPVNMTAMTNTVFSELTGPAERERIDFTVAPLPAAHGDPTLIHQVLANLIGNAVKFSRNRHRAVIEVGSLPAASQSPPGEEQATARMDEKPPIIPDNGRSAGSIPIETVYFVRDNGAGFDMKYVDKIFGVFQRLHGKKEFEGTGVGLAIVQRIIHRHGGRLWAEGKPDKGATFYFSLAMKDNETALNRIENRR